jgi:hypothetical protein
MHDLMEAKKALQEFGKRADLDAIAKAKLTVIADALGEAEQRLKALEEVVEELAAGAKQFTLCCEASWETSGLIRETAL